LTQRLKEAESREQLSHDIVDELSIARQKNQELAQHRLEHENISSNKVSDRSNRFDNMVNHYMTEEGR